MFSCLGDALLNVDLFAFGMVMFGVAQVLYASAFGWKPVKLWIGLALYIFGAIGMNVKKLTWCRKSKSLVFQFFQQFYSCTKI